MIEPNVDQAAASVGSDRRSLAGQVRFVIAASTLSLAVLAFWQGDYYFSKLVLLFAGAAAVAAISPSFSLNWSSHKRTWLIALFVMAVFVVSGFTAGVGSRTIEVWSWWLGLGMVLLLLTPELLHSAVPLLWATAVAGYGLLQFVVHQLPASVAELFHWFRPALDSYDVPDYSSFFGLSNFSSEFVVLLLPLLFLQLSKARGPRKNVVATVAGLSLLYIVVGGSRAAWVASGVVVLVFSLARFKSSNAFKIIALLSLLVPAAVVTKIIVAPSASDQFRLEVGRASLGMIVEHPTGVGVGWFPDRIDEYLEASAQDRSTRTQHRVMDPHNEFLRVSTEAGLVGLILLFAALFLWGRAAVVRWKAGSPEHLAGFLALLVFMLTSFPGRTVSGLIGVAVLLSLLAGRKSPVVRTGWMARVAPVLLLLICTVFAARFSLAEQQFRSGLAWMSMAPPRVDNGNRNFTKTIQYNPYHRSARLGLMRAQFQQREFELVGKTGRPLLEVKRPPDAVLRLALFSALQNKDVERTVQYLNRRLGQIAAWSEDEVLAVAQQLSSLGLYEPARDLMAQERFRQNPPAILIRSLAEIQLGEYALAEQLLGAYTKDHPHAIGLRIAQAIAMEKGQKYEEGFSYLTTLGEAFPDDPRVPLYQARIAWLQNDHDGAYQLVGRALAIDPQMSFDAATETDPLFATIYRYVVHKKMAELKQGKHK